jgi:hypothetical protein
MRLYATPFVAKKTLKQPVYGTYVVYSVESQGGRFEVLSDKTHADSA